MEPRDLLLGRRHDHADHRLERQLDGSSLDGGSIAFQSNADLTGANPDGGVEIFLWDGSITTQVTDSSSPVPASVVPSLDGGEIAWYSNADLTGGNPDNNYEIFLYDGTITQVTTSAGATSTRPSLSGGAIAFSSNANFTGGNPDGTYEIYYFDGASLQQVTSQPVGGAIEASLDGMNLAYAANSNPQGEGDLQVFAASCLPDPVPEDVPAGGALALIALALLVALAGVTVLRR